MLSFFERLLNPFPQEEPDTPPDTLVAFCLHYTRGMWKPIFLISALTSILAVAEVALFGVMGNLVDWLSQSDPNTFFDEHASDLIFYGALVLLVLPLLTFLHSSLIHQTMLGNYPMAIRWLICCVKVWPFTRTTLLGVLPRKLCKPRCLCANRS